ncbi:unnamed protein product [Rotaria magnacalcarata]|uniref:Outer dynein arm-docking complex subunit 4 n=1 Tax=Rotaria magnacalcarata TaxID=392030 RepID=A0A816EN51_9BILA|nr:unnamed protein product [Rotaria magnacalcarata]CAF3974733.1 unnamed protein product [Rotaria magnacalcarata]
MKVETARPRSAPKSATKNMTTSVGRFYEKRHQLYGALDQYSKLLSSNPDDTATYIDRSRVYLKMGSINKAQQDTDLALNLIGEPEKNSNLLFYYVCLQKAEVLYADGEFELALMYFHRANKVKPAQQTCVEGIRKTTEILECTICNPHVHLTVSNNLVNVQEKKIEQNVNLLNRPPIRKSLPSIEIPLTEYTNREANRLLIEVAKDRKLLINLYNDKQPAVGFTGFDKAKAEAHQAISIIESQLKFLDKAECLHVDENLRRENMICTSEIDRSNRVRMAEEELMYLQNLPSKEKSTEILYRAMKIINCLHSSENISSNTLDSRARLMLAESFRLVGQSYNEIKLFDQSFENYKQAYEILVPLKDANCLYRATFDIARSLILANKYSEAIETFDEMLDKATSDSERAFVNQYLSFSYLNLTNYDQAKKYAYECLDYATLANEELFRIEANILLGKIYFELNDFQRAEEYIVYAQNLKDQLGDLNQMKYLDELLLNIKSHKEKIFQENVSSFVKIEEKYLNKLNDQWISSIMQENENKEIKVDDLFIREFNNKTISNWRILTPYYRLFDMCIERKKKTRRNVDHIKQPITSSSPSLPLISTANSALENIQESLSKT